MPEQTAIKHKHQVAIFQKGEIFGALFLIINNVHHAAISYDPRCQLGKQFYYRSFPTPAEAETAFHDKVATTVDRGWSVAYNGRPYFG